MAQSKGFFGLRKGSTKSLTLVQAQNALTVFPPKAQTAPFTGINTLFPFIENPTPLQQKVLDLDISQPGPQLFILEDVTGAGKTEAALILAHRLMAAGKAQGLFFGLPPLFFYLEGIEGAIQVAFDGNAPGPVVRGLHFQLLLRIASLARGVDVEPGFARGGRPERKDGA